MLAFILAACIAVLWTVKSLSRAFVPSRLPARCHLFTCVLRPLHITLSLSPFLSTISEILILGPTTLLTVWPAPCTLGALSAVLTPAEPHEACAPRVGLEG